MDVISLHQAGFTNAVASLGTALTSGHASLIKRYVSEVYLTYDSDDAGTRAALRAVPIMREAGIAAKFMVMVPNQRNRCSVVIFERIFSDGSTIFA